MNIFFPKEAVNESRVALTIETATKFQKKGINILIEKNLSNHLGVTDEKFEELGVKSVSRQDGFSDADIICNVRNLSEEELDEIKPGTLVISFLDPFNENP
jgi:NAD(P) transhydrogenase subunit alpha